MQAFFGHLLLSDLPSMINNLLPHEYEGLLARMFALSREVFVVRPHDGTDSEVSASCVLNLGHSPPLQLASMQKLDFESTSMLNSEKYSHQLFRAYVLLWTQKEPS